MSITRSSTPAEIGFRRIAGRFGALLGALLLGITGQAALAQAYPIKPVRLIVTSAPGVVTDLNARLIAGKLSTIGTANIPSTLGDMTSNGDGTLYFLRDVATPTLYQLSPKDASTIASSSISAAGGGSQALAFWGGSFYAFENSAISEYDPIKKTTKAFGTAPLQVTGAGQSTCVPKVPPPPK